MLCMLTAKMKNNMLFILYTISMQYGIGTQIGSESQQPTGPKDHLICIWAEGFEITKCLITASYIHRGLEWLELILCS